MYYCILLEMFFHVFFNIYIKFVLTGPLFGTLLHFVYLKL